jgi:hypothetical protein
MGQFNLAGHEKNDPAYILSKCPTWLWISSYSKEKRWLPGTDEIVALPGFDVAYEPFQIQFPEYTVNVYRRKAPCP